MLIKSLELLAPAGKWDVLESVIKAGADAVYLGGKKFNMRLVRSGFNFTDQELERATEFLHSQNKKIYVTVNNLYFDNELDELKEYLLFLSDINVDALIVQDMAVSRICREMNINIPLHASVQMGIGNLASAKYLEGKGFERVVLSKNLSLQEITMIHEGSHLGIEIFAHGELCISHTGHCYMSQLAFGKSGNRGSCKKPCRWEYKLNAPGYSDDSFKRYLSNKDLCAYPYLSELVQAGVTSFKIEGRMKSTDYLIPLVGIYRSALDRLMENPVEYCEDLSEMDKLIKNRERDYTPGHYHGRPSLDSVGLTGEREPVFNTAPVQLTRLENNDFAEYKYTFRPYRPELTVKVADVEALHRLEGLHVDNVILGMEFCRQEGNKWIPRLIEQAVHLARANNQKVYLETPELLTDNDWNVFENYGSERMQMADGIIVNDYGCLFYLHRLMPEKEIWAGPALNITNSKAYQDLQNSGVKRLVMSYELGVNNLSVLAEEADEIQIMVQGPMRTMGTDLCLTGSLNNKNGDKCSVFCNQGEYALMDKYGQKYTIRTDINCRNYLYFPRELCLLPHLPELAELGIRAFAIEGQFYKPDLLQEIVSIYSNAIDNIEQGQWQQHKNYQHLLELLPDGLIDNPFLTCTPENV